MKRFLVLAAAAAVVAGFAVSSTNAAVTVTESPERHLITNQCRMQLWKIKKFQAKFILL